MPDSRTAIVVMLLAALALVGALALIGSVGHRDRGIVIATTAVRP